jgi:membrane protein YqaA with SNARE-associated domain
VANNVWIAFLVLLLPGVWNVVLGLKGNEWAWQHRRFESMEQFEEIQAVWARWGLILFILGVVVPAIALAAIALFTLQTVGIELPE